MCLNRHCGHRWCDHRLSSWGTIFFNFLAFHAQAAQILAQTLLLQLKLFSALDGRVVLLVFLHLGLHDLLVGALLRKHGRLHRVGGSIVLCGSAVTSFGSIFAEEILTLR